MLIALVIVSIVLCLSLMMGAYLFYRLRSLSREYSDLVSKPAEPIICNSGPKVETGTHLTPKVYTEREAFLRRLLSSSSSSDVSQAAQGIISTLVADRELKIDYVTLFTWNDKRQVMGLLGSNVPQSYLKALCQYANSVHTAIKTKGASAHILCSEGILSRVTAKERRICFEYYIPLHRGNDVIGALLVESTKSSCQQALSLEFFQLALENISLVLYNVILLQRVLQQANVDNLTQLYNRTYLKTFSANLINAQVPYAVLIMDIDFFKRCNDTYGHAVGDLVLQHVSDVLSKSIREGFDGVFRYGGEEFVILLREVDESLAVNRGELIRKTIENMRIRYGAGSDDYLSVTISMGIVQADLSLPVETNITSADKALYWSKEHGRNQVNVFNPEVMHGK